MVHGLNLTSKVTRLPPNLERSLQASKRLIASAGECAAVLVAPEAPLGALGGLGGRHSATPNIPEPFLLRTQILYCARGLSPSQKGLRRNFSTNRAVLPDAFKQAFPREKCL